MKTQQNVEFKKLKDQWIKNPGFKKGFEYLAQANAKRIKDKWGFNVVVDKSSRSFDFAVYNPKNKQLKLLEVNFYNGGGSKLKAVCGEFKGLYNELKIQNIDFIWITDGNHNLKIRTNHEIPIGWKRGRTMKRDVLTGSFT